MEEYLCEEHQAHLSQHPWGEHRLVVPLDLELKKVVIGTFFIRTQERGGDLLWLLKIGCFCVVQVVANIGIRYFIRYFIKLIHDYFNFIFIFSSELNHKLTDISNNVRYDYSAAALQFVHICLKLKQTVLVISMALSCFSLTKLMFPLIKYLTNTRKF